MYKQSLHLPRISDKYYFYISLTNNKQPCLCQRTKCSQVVFDTEIIVRIYIASFSAQRPYFRTKPYRTLIPSRGDKGDLWEYCSVFGSEGYTKARVFLRLEAEQITTLN